VQLQDRVGMTSVGMTSAAFLRERERERERERGRKGVRTRKREGECVCAYTYMIYIRIHMMRTCIYLFWESEVTYV